MLPIQSIHVHLLLQNRHSFIDVRPVAANPPWQLSICEKTEENQGLLAIAALDRWIQERGATELQSRWCQISVCISS